MARKFGAVTSKETSFTRDGNDHAIVLLEAPSTQTIAPTKLAISFIGAAATDSNVQIKFVRFSTLGTGGTSATVVDETGAGVTFRTSALTGEWSTTEPTISVTLAQVTLYPLGTLIVPISHLAQDGTYYGIAVNGGSGLGAFTVVVTLSFEE